MLGPPDRARLGALAVACVVFVPLCATLPSVWQGRPAITDVPVYERYGDAIERGSVPYRDFRLEYPPGSLAVFAVPSLVTHGTVSYARAFALEMMVCGLVALGACLLALRALAASPRRLAAGLAPVALSPLLLGPLLLSRFDLYPAALTALAVALLLAGRDRLGSGVLGAAVAAKLYPVVLVPLAAAWVWRRRGRRESLLALGACIGVAVLVFLPFLVLSPGGVWWSLRRQLDRPLQIESLGAAVLLALHHAAGMPLAWASSHGSQNLTGTVAVVASILTTVAQAAAFLFVAWRFARRSVPAGHHLADACAAVLVVFVALGKVLSPQFLVWLLPAVGLVAGKRLWSAVGLVAAACLLTRGWFPDRYWRLVFDFDGLASWLVLARDLCLAALLVLLADAVRSRSAPVGSP
jgi:uncharacterized membrane protein